MSRAEGAPIPDVSVVVPIVERHDDLVKLYHEYAAAIRRSGRSCEFVFVIDGRQHVAIEALTALKRETGDPITIVVLGRSSGEAAALAVGFRTAKADVIVTLAAYFQVVSSGVSEAIGLVESDTCDLLITRRFPRRDAAINRIQAVMFHFLVRMMTSTRFHDISCGFRVMKKRVAEELALYGDLHRFIPIMAHSLGFTVKEIELQQRSEDTRARFVAPGIYLRRILDILTIFFLVKFTRKPLRFFGLIGSVVFASGFAIAFYLLLYRTLGLGGIAGRPLLLLGALLMVLGVQSFSIGLLGEIIIFTHVRQLREYRVAEIL